MLGVRTLGVEEGHVKAHKANEATEDEDGVRELFESGEVEEGAAMCREDADAHDGVGEDEGG
jgi:hypothetical protein